MNVDVIPSDIVRLAAQLPKFSDGRIDYTHSKEAAVLNIFVVYNGKVLLVKRGEKVGWLKGRWHLIAGFLDEMKTLREKTLEELEEETGIQRGLVGQVRALSQFIERDHEKTWIVYPVLIELIGVPNIRLDWENTDFVWVNPAQVQTYDVMAGVLSQLRMWGLVPK
jgi:ADP-ribose pyrophosphatase YjhB (NUDIX family)